MLLAKMRKNDIITHSWRCFCISHPSLPPHFFTSLSPLLSTNGSDSSQSSLRRDGTLTTANASGGEPGSGGPARTRRIRRAPGASSRRGREGGRRAGAEIRAPGEGRRERERAALAVPQRASGGGRSRPRRPGGSAGGDAAGGRRKGGDGPRASAGRGGGDPPFARRGRGGSPTGSTGTTGLGAGGAGADAAAARGRHPRRRDESTPRREEGTKVGTEDHPRIQHESNSSRLGTERLTCG